MNCPVCPETQLQMTDRQGVEIDYCPNAVESGLIAVSLTRLSTAVRLRFPLLRSRPRHRNRPPHRLLSNRNSRLSRTTVRRLYTVILATGAMMIAITNSVIRNRAAITKNVRVF